MDTEEKQARQVSALIRVVVLQGSQGSVKPSICFYDACKVGDHMQSDGLPSLP